MNGYQEINEKLFFEYSTYLKNLIALFEPSKRTEISLPLFMYVFPEYEKLTNKIMVVGKETYGWFGNLSQLEKAYADKIIENYRSFELGKHYYYSPFWRFSKTFFKALNPFNDLNGLLWTNISKIDQNQTTPDLENQIKNFEGYKLLEKEISFTKPEIIVFLTSWNQDNLLKTIFSEIEFIAFDDIETQYLVKLNHKNLPSKSFRTYHPRFLNSRKSLYSIDEIIDQIIKKCA